MLCEKHIIPFAILYNESELEQFINELLSKNFNLDKHMESLVYDYHQTNYNQWSDFITEYGLPPQ